ncbi:MAG: ImmA/IrrE family metallo-endopeptidase [Planctomycetota bacterium]|nr:ImmA/IrrE family metallo-endopeptidase [Planctomycetota bacterium]
MAVNPAMIVLARESRGWTQKDLAKVIRAAQATISKYEIGAIPVPDYHRDQICTALNYERELLQQPDLLVGLGGDFLYRKRARLSAKSQRRVEAEANIRKIQVVRLLRGAAIEERFPFPSIPLNEVAGKPETAAQELRRAFRLPSGRIHNLTKVLENAGAIIFTIDFGTDYIDGTNIRIPGIPPLMFLNKNVPGERHRFNLAHELGHLVMHFATAIGDPEVEANAFANEFLMPKVEIRSDLQNLDLSSALRLKRVWGVSMAAIIHRAYKLSVIPESRYRRLFTQLGAGGMRTREPEPLPFETPETFDKLLEIHRTRLGFSDDDLRKLLLTDELGEIPVPHAPQMRLTGLFEETI